MIKRLPGVGASWAKLRAGGLGAGALGAAVLVTLGAGTAQAETLDIAGVYAAGVDLPGEIEVIAIGRLGGDAGPDGEVAILAELGAAAVDGESYFRVLPADAALPRGRVRVGDQPEGLNTLAPDAVLSGTLRTDVAERQVEPRISNECVARDERDNCIERKEIKIPCFELRVQVIPRLILTGAEGFQLYSNTQSLAEVTRYCRNDAVIPSPYDLGDGLIDQLAQGVRLDLAPIERLEEIRVMETRKNLVSADRRAFSEALALTKRDQRAACAVWSGLEATNPAQAAVLFNVGLCREAAGELEEAARYYAAVLSAGAGRDYAQQGLARIASRQRAAIQLEARWPQ